MLSFTSIYFLLWGRAVESDIFQIKKMRNLLDKKGEEDEGSEESSEDRGEGSEESSEEGEGSEESSEEGEGSEESSEDSEEGDGSEEGSEESEICREENEIDEEDEENGRGEAIPHGKWSAHRTGKEEEGGEETETDEGSGDERCEASPCFKWEKRFVTRRTIEEGEGGEEDKNHEGNEQGSEDEGNVQGSEDEGNEQGSEDGKEDDDGEDERCEASQCFKWWETNFIARPTSEENEEDESGEEDECEGNEQDSEDEKEAEDGEDERCEASSCVKSGKKFIVPPTSEESEEDESNEDGEDERCEASSCVKSGKKFIVPPTSEESEEDESSEDDEIIEGPEYKESKGDEETDISDSEINEYKEAVHKLLKFRTYKIKGPNGQFRCPFCVGMEKQEYNRLLEHAVQVAEGSTKSAKQRANHFAMAKYLAIDLASEVEQLPQSANRILCNLTLEIDLRKKNMDQLQSKYEEKRMAVRKILEEKDETQHTFFEEARNMLCIARDQSKRVLEQQEMLSFDFENKRQRLNSWNEELNKREAALTEEKRMMDDLTRKKNDLDLLEVGKELIKGLEDMPSHCRVKIGVKRRWAEIDEKAFMSECKKRYRLNEEETKAFELCCFWVKQMNDDKGNPQRLVKENEKLLRGLKDKWGNKIYYAVVAVVEYNSNGNGMELWNFEEDRKASHCEVIRHVFSQWKTLQCKRDKIDEVIKTLF